MNHLTLQGNRTTNKIFLYIKPSTSRKLQLFYIHHVPADANAQKTRENEIRPRSALNVCGNYPPKKIAEYAGEAVGIPAVDVVAVSLCLCPSAVALLPLP